MTTTTKPELNPCPFCGGADLVIHRGNNHASINCFLCKGKGPHTLIEDAEKAWNTRAPQWQPIETAPKDGSTILLWGIYCSHAATASWDGKKWAASWDDSSVVEYMSDFGIDYKDFDVPSHWLPLPEAPGVE